MTTLELEKRLEQLEEDVARLKQERPSSTLPKKPWWEEIRGTFKDDPAYIEAMRLGREWRQSQRLEDEEPAS